MLDIRLIRERLDFVKERLALVGCAAEQVEVVADLDRRRRESLVEVETMRAERRKASKEIGRMKPGPEQETAKSTVRSLGERAIERERVLADLERELDAAMLELPNLPHPSVPPGLDESANVVVRTEGEPRAFGFEPKPHWEIGEA